MLGAAGVTAAAPLSRVSERARARGGSVDSPFAPHYRDSVRTTGLREDRRRWARRVSNLRPLACEGARRRARRARLALQRGLLAASCGRCATLSAPLGTLWARRAGTPELLGAMHLRRLRAGQRWWRICSPPPFLACRGTGWSSPFRSRVSVVCTRWACPALPAEPAYTARERSGPAAVKASASASSAASCEAVALTVARPRSYPRA